MLNTITTKSNGAGGHVALGTLAAALWLACPARLTAADWTQFRGPNASGVAAESGPLPAEFSFENNVRWMVPLGEGIASPIVCGDRAFCTAMTGPETFSVFCFDAASGKELWRVDRAMGKLPPITPPNSHASSTPASDGQRVYVYASTLGLMAFDVSSGSEIWHYPLPQPAYLLDWGAAASPIVHEGMVIFNQDDDLSPFLLALDAATGQLRWKTERPDMLAGYAVPVLCEAEGRTDLVVAGTGKLKGYNPQTGEELWTCNTLLRTIMTTPVVREGVIYIAVESFGDTDRVLKFALLQWKDTNQDGKLTKAELPEAFWEKFDQANGNRDDFLEGAELDHAFQSPTNMVGGGKIVQAIRGGGQGDVTSTHMVWALENSAPSNMASPLLVGEQLFLVKKGGISNSFDPATGAAQWASKRIRNLGEYLASPVAADGKIYVVGENGFVVVLAQGPKLEILAKNDMGETCIATPAIADGALFIRTRQKLYCISSGH